ncbi:LysE/ArgO family amino acid transporter [Eggerthella sinensis]|uniref:LysE/ArgO family amino acid transporter n=1 Tax=Eggerthella sinensis TaxID=242230 RepID=UPI001D05D300|nr:LysE family transporter [Eggerthella sinensis]MCB7038486.1 LysE family transporter [Eggerthella sinensis]
MMLSVMLQGFTMGLAYVAPIGMQNLFVINAAVSQPRPRALITALFVTLFDMSLTLACFFGVGAVMDAVPWLGPLMQLVGGGLVVAIGIVLIVPRRKKDAEPTKKDAAGSAARARMNQPGLRGAFVAALLVTWCNPQAFIDGTMMLGAFRATFGGADGLAFVAGACMASLVWFPGMALIVSALGSRFNDTILRVINVVCGLVVIAYGLRLIAAFFGWI